VIAFQEEARFLIALPLALLLWLVNTDLSERVPVIKPLYICLVLSLTLLTAAVTPGSKLGPYYDNDQHTPISFFVPAPPRQFDHAYSGRLITNYVTWETIRLKCPGYLPPVACIARDGDKCILWLPRINLVFTYPRAPRGNITLIINRAAWDALRRHSIARCNGWAVPNFKLIGSAQPVS
jgi:hypothetical protein